VAGTQQIPRAHWTFFTGPTFPPYAIEQLGYPSFNINGGGYAPGFNLAIEDGASLIGWRCFTSFVIFCGNIFVACRYVKNNVALNYQTIINQSKIIINTSTVYAYPATNSVQIILFCAPFL
jgi:hypothetical protein